MAFNNNGPRISTDRFGNPYQLKAAKEVVNKKTGQVVNDCYAAYFELGGKLYKVECSPANKKSKNGDNQIWVKITKKEQNKRTSQSM